MRFSVGWSTNNDGWLYCTTNSCNSATKHFQTFLRFRKFITTRIYESQWSLTRHIIRTAQFTGASYLHFFVAFTKRFLSVRLVCVDHILRYCVPIIVGLYFVALSFYHCLLITSSFHHASLLSKGCQTFFLYIYIHIHILILYIRMYKIEKKLNFVTFLIGGNLYHATSKSA